MNTQGHDSDGACPVADRCGGCPWLGDAPEAQRARRRARFVAEVPGAREARVSFSPVTGPGRARVEVQVRDGRLGMLGRSDGAEASLGVPSAPPFVPIDDCPAGRPELRAWLAAIIADPPPLVRASLRLRVGLDGTRGLWLDADRAALAAVTQADSGLGAWAARMVAAGVVLEVGQRQEAVARGASGGLERVLATRRAWSNTWVGRNPWPLLTRLSDFAQPSPEGNRALLDAVLEAVQATGERRWLELGAGAGNMTLPLLAAGYVVRAVELDVAALGENLAAARAIPPRRLDAAGRALIAGLDGCEPRVGSLDRGREVAGWLIGEPRARGAAGEPIRAVLADPPRSGLGAFGEALGGLSRTLRPRVLVYVSCWHTALVRDARLLELQGYRLANARGVEQFRDSPEVEWVTVWRDARA